MSAEIIVLWHTMTQQHCVDGFKFNSASVKGSIEDILLCKSLRIVCSLNRKMRNADLDAVGGGKSVIVRKIVDVVGLRKLRQSIRS